LVSITRFFQVFPYCNLLFVALHLIIYKIPSLLYYHQIFCLAMRYSNGAILAAVLTMSTLAVAYPGTKTKRAIIGYHVLVWKKGDEDKCDAAVTMTDIEKKTLPNYFIGDHDQNDCSECKYNL